jgi:hypothetical protein
MWKRIKHWWAATGDLAKLQGISDRQLRDMGLKREDLRALVLGHDIKADGPRLCPPVSHLARS